MAAVVLAKKAFVVVLWPSFIIIALTLVFGRVFCAWICPLGTLIDIAGRCVPEPVRRIRMGYMKYVLLVVVLLSAFLNAQVLGFFDPFSLLVRSMVFSIDPGFRYIMSLGFDSVYAVGPAWLSNMTEVVYGGLKIFILPYKQSFFYLSFFSFVLLASIFLLERLGKRFWCRNLCPLGGLLALISKLAIFKRKPLKLCSHCGDCASGCRMDVFDSQNRFAFEECTLCMDCLEFCPDRITTFTFTRPFRQKTAIDLSRRQLLAAGVTGLALPAMMNTNALSQQGPQDLIRPPGSLPEIEFSAACVRCGECMKVCINNALQPLVFEKGIEGMFTPKLVPRLGYCEFNCTLCSQVCPTGAIEKLDQRSKHAFVMGEAIFDKDKCLVYGYKKECIVCEEHCPTHDKAIKFEKTIALDSNGKSITLQKPYVVPKLCIGCGICEYICPVQGEAAIRVIGKNNRKTEGIY